MKKSFVYLLVFAALLQVFTYVYFSKKNASEMERFSKTKIRLKDSLSHAQSLLANANYFTLEQNENAKNYFDGKDIAAISQLVKDKAMELNTNPKGNPLVPYDQLNDQKFILNKITILNHRWLIADFSDGKLWGEVVVKYFVNENQTVDFQTMEGLLHTAP